MFSQARLSYCPMFGRIRRHECSACTVCWLEAQTVMLLPSLNKGGKPGEPLEWQQIWTCVVTRCMPCCWRWTEPHSKRANDP